jgi:hypothetical protein
METILLTGYKATMAKTRNKESVYACEEVGNGTKSGGLCDQCHFGVWAPSIVVNSLVTGPF